MGYKGEHTDGNHSVGDVSGNSFGPGSAEVVPHRVPVVSPNKVASDIPASGIPRSVVTDLSARAIEAGLNPVDVTTAQAYSPPLLAPHEAIAQVIGQLNHDKEGVERALAGEKAVARAREQLTVLYAFRGGDPEVLDEELSKHTGRASLSSLTEVNNAAKEFATLPKDEQAKYHPTMINGAEVKELVVYETHTTADRRRAVIDALDIVTTALPPCDEGEEAVRKFIDRQIKVIDRLAIIAARQAERDGMELLSVYPEVLREPVVHNAETRMLIHLPKAVEEDRAMQQNEPQPDGYIPAPETNTVVTEVVGYNQLVQAQQKKLQEEGGAPQRRSYATQYGTPAEHGVYAKEPETVDERKRRRRSQLERMMSDMGDRASVLRAEQILTETTRLHKNPPEVVGDVY